MEHSKENIPSVIFDWIEVKDFASLTSVEQKIVLKYLTEQEYDELYEGASGIQSIYEMDGMDHNDRIKESLLARFEKRTASSDDNNRLIILPSMIWKAASVMVFLTCCWMFYELRKKNDTITYLMSHVDTMYLTTEPEPLEVKVFDTVYLKKEIAKREKTQKVPDNKRVSRPSKYSNVSVSSDINVLSIKDYEAVPNKQKRNSLKEDTLMRKYRVMTL